MAWITSSGMPEGGHEAAAVIAIRENFARSAVSEGSVGQKLQQEVGVLPELWFKRLAVHRWIINLWRSLGRLLMQICAEGLRLVVTLNLFYLVDVRSVMSCVRIERTSREICTSRLIPAGFVPFHPGPAIRRLRPPLPSSRVQM
jgi:hypothetical protein